MKRIAIAMMIVCLLCGMLSGCIRGASDGNVPETGVPNSDNATEETAAATEETVDVEEVPEVTVPFNIPDMETVPPKIDDSDYQLPPGETPTYEPQVS